MTRITRGGDHGCPGSRSRSRPPAEVGRIPLRSASGLTWPPKPTRATRISCAHVPGMAGRHWVRQRSFWLMTSPWLSTRALANAVEHAHPPDHPHPMMRLQARVDHHQLLITISDHGRWRVPPDRTRLPRPRSGHDALSHYRTAPASHPSRGQLQLRVDLHSAAR